MATQKRYDGSISLSDLTGALIADEQLEFLKLKDVKKQPGGTDNIATYEDDDSGQPPPIILIAVKAGQSATSIIGEQIAKHKTVIFHSNIFVGSKSTEVIGFR